VERPQGEPLPHAPRPVAVLSSTARIAICGQAPGVRVHASGRPFTDPSGDRLRQWLGVSADEFYDSARITIVPMGFCFPGLDAKGSDLPPRRECASAWRGRIFAAMPQVELLLLVGSYAQRWHLGDRARPTLSATVAEWRNICESGATPQMLPLPHPSWRNNAWIRRNEWFGRELLPFLQHRVRDLL
jgi:uracil-DNA glycosylase